LVLNAIEFETIYKDGVIAVPEEYRSRFTDSQVRVIALQPSAPKGKKPLKFEAIRLNTPVLKFNREEAHER